MVHIMLMWKRLSRKFFFPFYCRRRLKLRVNSWGKIHSAKTDLENLGILSCLPLCDNPRLSVQPRYNGRHFVKISFLCLISCSRSRSTIRFVDFGAGRKHNIFVLEIPTRRLWKVSGKKTVPLSYKLYVYWGLYFTPSFCPSFYINGFRHYGTPLM